jgi:hypothetical protein
VISRVRIHKVLKNVKETKNLFLVTSTLNRNATHYNFWMGKEIAFVVKTSSITTKSGEFYTDSNGMDIVKRKYITQ